MDGGIEIKRKALMRCTLFEGLGGDDIDHLVSTSKILGLAPKTRLFSKGDPGDRLYIVTKGLVRISMASADGREVTLNLIGTGQMFGEIAVLDGGERTADATAVEETELVILERRDLLTFLESKPLSSIRMLARLMPLTH